MRLRRGVVWATAALVPLLWLAGGAGSAKATPVSEVAEGLELDGYFVESGAERLDTGQLRTIVGRSPVTLRPVVLAEAPPDGERAYADDVLAQVGGTVVAFSPEAIEVSSDELTDAAVENALDAADQLASPADTLGYLAAFSDSLDGLDAASGSAGARDGGIPVGLLLIGGLLFVAAVMAFVSSRRTKRAYAAQRARQLDEARQEVRGQVSAMAEEILSLTDRVAVAGDARSEQLFAEATQAYQGAQDHLERTATAKELEAVSDELDHARWQLSAVDALIDGRPAPPEPAQAPACFFDPTHGAGTDDAEIETPAGARQVHVCSYCAAKLRSGAAPEPRMIAVDGQQVPAAMAPRSYGGGGLGWLGDFAVVLGGSRRPYGWSGYGGVHRGQARGWGGWGGGIGGLGGFGTGGVSGAGSRRSRGRGGVRLGSGGRTRGGGGGRTRTGGGGRSRTGGSGRRR